MVKKLGAALIVVILAFYLFTDPTGSADLVKRAGEGGMNALSQVQQFLQALFS